MSIDDERKDGKERQVDAGKLSEFDETRVLADPSGIDDSGSEIELSITGLGSIAH